MALVGIRFEDLWKRYRRRVERVIRRILREYFNPDAFDLLMAAGQVALWEASVRYREEKSNGYSFWQFAIIRVRGAVLDELRSFDHVARGGRASIKKGEEDVLWLLHQSHVEIEDCLPDNSNLEQEAARHEIIQKVFNSTGIITAREEFALRRLLEGIQVLEIAKEMGLSPGRVCQIRTEAVEKIRKYTGCDLGSS